MKDSNYTFVDTAGHYKGHHYNTLNDSVCCPKTPKSYDTLEALEKMKNNNPLKFAFYTIVKTR